MLDSVRWGQCLFDRHGKPCAAPPLFLAPFLTCAVVEGQGDVELYPAVLGAGFLSGLNLQEKRGCLASGEIGSTILSLPMQVSAPVCCLVQTTRSLLLPLDARPAARERCQWFHGRARPGEENGASSFLVAVAGEGREEDGHHGRGSTGGKCTLPSGSVLRGWTVRLVGWSCWWCWSAAATAGGRKEVNDPQAENPRHGGVNRRIYQEAFSSAIIVGTICSRSLRRRRPQRSYGQWRCR